ncbi:hypothetical protein Tco_1202626 [Tanacetum coccineum]
MCSYSEFRKNQVILSLEALRYYIVASAQASVLFLFAMSSRLLAFTSSFSVFSSAVEGTVIFNPVDGPVSVAVTGIGTHKSLSLMYLPEHNLIEIKFPSKALITTC